MSEISIRVLGEDEWEQYKEFRLRALKESLEAFVADHATEAEYDEKFWRKRMRRSLRLLAERDSEPVGILSLRANTDLYENAAEIFGLFVPTELRGSGVAAGLVQAAAIIKRRDGWGGFFRGLKPRIVTTMPSTAICW